VTRPQRNYTDDERATALAAVCASGGNVREASRVSDIPRSTIREWMAESPETVARLAQQKTADLAVLMEDIAYKAAGIQRALLDYVAPADRIEVALDHWGDVNRAMGTAADKAQLLSGQPTARIEYVVDVDLADVD